MTNAKRKQIKQKRKDIIQKRVKGINYIICNRI